MIYLDNAATTFPKPQEVYDAINDCMVNYCANPGRSGHEMAMQAGRAIFDARESVANFFNIKTMEEVVFTFNATDSLNLAIKGLLKKGDHVITTSIEHNSVIRPIKEIENDGIENTIVDCDSEGILDPENIKKAIKPNTKLIVTTHASNVSGTLVDIEAVGKIAKEMGILYLVDASQTAGVYPIDVQAMNIDMLAMPGHKCLLGPQGTGVLYVNEKIKLKTLKEGGTGSKSEDLYQPDLYPDKYESGTHNTPGIVGIGAGIGFIEKTGIENIKKHEEQMCQYLIDGFKNIDGVKIYGPLDAKKRAAVVSINVDGMDSGEVTFILDRDYKIATRSGIHCAPVTHKTLGTLQTGAVRFSIGYFNTKEELDIAIEAIKNIAAK